MGELNKEAIINFICTPSNLSNRHTMSEGMTAEKESMYVKGGISNRRVHKTATGETSKQASITGEGCPIPTMVCIKKKLKQ
jgi:hypothetical protein